MESIKPKGKRGRPKKIKTDLPIIDPTIPKRKRGRPSKVIDGESNITIKPSKKSEMVPVEIVDDYIPPKILRNKRVFRFDKRVFHMFAHKYQGDIIIMGYVFDRLMRLYIADKIELPILDKEYYHKWWQGDTPLEPLVEHELATSHALMKGVPMQYKYPMIIDRDIYNEFERKCKIYPAYVANELVKMFVDEDIEIEIDISKYREWCTI